MTWVLIIWCALILVWAIAGGGSQAEECEEERTQALQEACEAGTGIGIAIVLLIGFFGFVFFGIIWWMTRPKGRDCPVCGEFVKKGKTRCDNCGHDFAVAARAPQAATPGGPPQAPG